MCFWWPRSTEFPCMSLITLMGCPEISCFCTYIAICYINCALEMYKPPCHKGLAKYFLRVSRFVFSNFSANRSGMDFFSHHDSVENYSLNVQTNAMPGYPIFRWSMMVMVEYGPMQDKILKVQLLRVWRSCKSQLGDVIGKKPRDQAKDVRIFGYFWWMKGGRVKNG